VFVKAIQRWFPRFQLAAPPAAPFPDYTRQALKLLRSHITGDLRKVYKPVAKGIDWT